MNVVQLSREHLGTTCISVVRTSHFTVSFFVIESALALSSNIMLHSLVPVSNTDMSCKELSASGSVSLCFLTNLCLLMHTVLA